MRSVWGDEILWHGPDLILISMLRLASCFIALLGLPAKPVGSPQQAVSLSLRWMFKVAQVHLRAVWGDEILWCASSCVRVSMLRLVVSLHRLFRLSRCRDLRSLEFGVALRGSSLRYELGLG